MNTLLMRMIGAARLDAKTYEQVEADATTTGSAVMVVVISSAAAAVGLGSRDPFSMFALTLASLLTWAVWISLTLALGKWLMPGPDTQTDLGEVLRTTGFSASPGVLRVFAGIPGIGLPIWIGVTIWMLFAFVVAIRQAFDYATFSRALAVCLLGWLIHGLLFFAFVWVAI
jgi:hypothetical protein